MGESHIYTFLYENWLTAGLPEFLSPIIQTAAKKKFNLIKKKLTQASKITKLPL